MQYLDQQADQLYLSLIKGAVPKDQIEILCSGQLTSSMGLINASIIGASHFFELKNSQGDTIFSEIVACKKLDVEQTFHYTKLRDINNYQQNIANIRYKFKTEQVNWDIDIMAYFKKLCDKTANHAGFSLRFQYPNKDNNHKQNLQAITMLTVLEHRDRDKNKIKIYSLHAYPNEKQLVLTETTLKTIN